MRKVYFKQLWGGLLVLWIALSAWASARVAWWMGWALVAFGLFTVGVFIVLLKSPGGQVK